MTPHRAGRRALATLLMGLVGAVGMTAAVPALAATDDEPPQVTWGIAPSDSEGEMDDRISFRLTLDPGESVTEYAVVTNFSDETYTFDLMASDGVVTESGVFDILPPEVEPEDVGTWVEIQDTVEVAAGGSEVVPFTITVPENATPGDHPGGIVASLSQAAAEEGGPQVAFNTRVGARIHLRVSGEIIPTITFSDVSTSYETSLNPFGPGELHVSYTVTNEGNVRLSSIQQAATSGPFGIPTGAQTPSDRVLGSQEEILPGQSVRVETTLSGAWPTGQIATTLRAFQDPVRDDPSLGEIEPTVVEETTWAMPWPQLAVLALLVGLVVWRVVRRRREKARVAKAIAAAKAEGAREAAGAGDGTAPASTGEASAVEPGTRSTATADPPAATSAKP